MTCGVGSRSPSRTGCGAQFNAGPVSAVSDVVMAAAALRRGGEVYSGSPVIAGVEQRSWVGPSPHRHVHPLFCPPLLQPCNGLSVLLLTDFFMRITCDSRRGS